MSSQFSKVAPKLVTVAVVAGLAMSVAACGRKGSLEPVRAETPQTQDRVEVSKTPEAPETKEQKRFLLDPLIDPGL